MKSLHKYLNLLLIAAFVSSSLYMPQAQASDMPALPQPGVMVGLSPEFTPAHLQGLTIHPDNALEFDFLIHRGDQSLDATQKDEAYKKLVKYFLASLTIPDKDQWVNLSPYERDRIVKDNFGKTEMGRDLLAQDYLLKQITSSLIYPEKDLGKKFWDKIYQRAWAEYHTTNVPVNTFNKVWIIPDEAAVYEQGNTVYVLRNHLKVMLEEDYLSLNKHSGITSKTKNTSTNNLGSQIIREIILPELEKEVNEGKNFANLRQIYSGMILATWYKKALKESLLGKIYANQAKTKGIDQDPKSNEIIYQQYLKAFKKGVFNYIKDDTDKYTNEVIPRKYFSGGAKDFAAVAQGTDVMSGFHNATVLDLTPKTGIPESIRSKIDPAMISRNSIDRVTVNLNTTQDNRYTRAAKAREYLSQALFDGEKPEIGTDEAARLRQKIFLNDEAMATINPELKKIIDRKLEGLFLDREILEEFESITTTTGLELALKKYQDKNPTSVGDFDISDQVASLIRTLEIYEREIPQSQKDTDRKTFSDRSPQYQSNIPAANTLGVEIAEQTSDWAKQLPVLTTLYSGNQRWMISGKEGEALQQINKSGETIGIPYPLRTTKGKRKWQPSADALAILSNLIVEPKQLIVFDDNEYMGVSDPLGTQEKLKLSALIERLFGTAKGNTITITNEEMVKIGNKGQIRNAVNYYYSLLSNETLEVVPQQNTRGIQLRIVDTAMMMKQKKINFTQGIIHKKQTPIRQFILQSSQKQNPKTDFGGIDLNSANLNLQIKRDGQGVPLPLAQQDMAQLKNIQGLEPVIIEIKPAVNLPILTELQQKLQTP